MLADPWTEVGRGQFQLLVAADLLAELLLVGGEVAKVVGEFRGRVQAGQVRVVLAVAEPAPHLQQRVVGVGPPDVVRDEQPLQGQTAGEFVAADEHGAQVRVAFVVQLVLAAVVQDEHGKSAAKDLADGVLDVLEAQQAGGVYRRGDRYELGVPALSQLRAGGALGQVVHPLLPQLPQAVTDEVGEHCPAADAPLRTWWRCGWAATP